MTKTLLLLGLLGGCVTTPIGNLYSEHARCVNDGAVGCDALWTEIERRERMIIRRQAKLHCTAGRVDVHDDWGHRACASRSDLDRFLGR